jgi:outer membrane protein assembly factor BamB
VIKAARIEGALGGYSSSPVAAEGKVWLASEEGKVTVLRAGGEWEVLAVNDLGEGCYATPALAKGVIYLRTEEALYAFSTAASK